MKNLVIFFLFLSGLVSAQTYNEYEISFENAVHHEANISQTFNNLPNRVLEVRMARSSPGRYAIHEFAKNVYNVKAYDSKGNALTITRPNPYQWDVAGHDGTVKFTYTLFGDRGDGTYLQIDETHAHLNMPATFAFARGLDYRPIRVKFNVRTDLRWKIATQLKPLEGSTFMAPNLQYFMDSPTEISDFVLREFDEESNGKKYKIRIALHTVDAAAVADAYLDGVKKIVKQEKAAFGSLPDFDYGTYTFLGCYMPQASGDGMEHRNSTYVVGSYALNKENISRAFGTVSHEFFHAWNVERIRPFSLEPFNFEEANMSGELWFAEGFTNYFGNLFMCRAGIRSQKEHVERLSGAINYVKNTPGRSMFNPIEMSMQAPFADAATFIDRTNMPNTFISYYSYGEVIALALDLTLRNMSNHSLEDFMKLMWIKHGSVDRPYTVQDIRAALSEYTSADFAEEFFNKYIFGNDLPDYEKLLATMGVTYELAAPGKPYMGVRLQETDDGVLIAAYPTIGAAAYKAGLESGDIITMVDDAQILKVDDLSAKVSTMSSGTTVTVKFQRQGVERTCKMVLDQNPEMKTGLYEDSGKKVDRETLKKREAWLGAK